MEDGGGSQAHKYMALLMRIKELHLFLVSFTSSTFPGMASHQSENMSSCISCKKSYNVYGDHSSFMGPYVSINP